MQRRTDELAVRADFDRHRDRTASGMSDPQMCVSGGDLFCLPGMLADQKVKIENHA